MYVRVGVWFSSLFCLILYIWFVQSAQHVLKEAIFIVTIYPLEPDISWAYYGSALPWYIWIWDRFQIFTHIEQPVPGEYNLVWNHGNQVQHWGQVWNRLRENRIILAWNRVFESVSNIPTQYFREDLPFSRAPTTRLAHVAENLSRASALLRRQSL